MRVSKVLLGCLLVAAPLLAAKKITSPTVTGGNDDIDVTATISLTQEEVTQKLGADPGKGVVLVHVVVTPKTEKPVQVSPDDFILLAHDDGEKSKPFDPEQLAGQGALVIRDGSDQAGKKGGKGGLMIGMGGMGGGGGSPGKTRKDPITSAKMDEKSPGNEKLLQQLKAKQLPQKDSADPVEGDLYFALEGKHKLKHLALLYRGPAGKLNLEFQH
jgi:hypothetical protein